MIITRTPFRLSFFGGGTDYNNWFEEHGGLVIASSISHYAYISVRNLPPFFEYKTRIVYSKTETINHLDEIQHGGVRSCMEYMNIDQPVEIHYDGDLPARSGIGSSSSFTVGMVNALYALKNQMVSKQKLAQDAIHVEQVVANENVGIQDQIMAAYGGLQVINMGPGKHYTVDPLITTPEYIDYLQSHILLAFTGLTRTASEMAAKQVEKIDNGDINQKMHSIHSIATEALQVIASQGEADQLGQLCHETWEIKRTLTDAVTNNYIDELYTIAKSNGAYGGRLLGAGGGGFMMFWAPPEKHQAIKDALPQLKVWVPVKFDFDGSKVILLS